MSFNGTIAAVVGGGGLAPSLGRKGTVSDITLYNNKVGDTVLSFVEPSSYPEKIQPLTSSLNIGEQVIFNVSQLDRYFAETVVALDAYGTAAGGLVIGEGVDSDAVSEFIKDTSISSYPLLEGHVVGLREWVASNRTDRQGDVIVQVDHSFTVKGVGTVALGVVKQGTVRKYDELSIYPLGGVAYVKSMQVHDTDVSEAASGLRIGLALKDVGPEDVERGSVLALEDSVECVEEILVDFTLSKYYSRDICVGDVFMANSYLNYVPARVTEGCVKPGGSGRVRLALEKKMPLTQERIVFLEPGQKTPRVIGHGRPSI
ncbi:MAG: EF-Tu/IF-2/RF-3 family GTPase [Candidatus Altiarchaeota archaeon]